MEIDNEKASRYKLNSIFIVIVIALIVSLVSIPAYIWAKYHFPYILSAAIYPHAPHSTAYYDSDFLVIRDPVGGYPTGEAIFYKVEEDGSLKRVYQVSHCTPGMMRPTRVNNTFYFPHTGSRGEHKDTDFLTILKDGKVTRKKMKCVSLENIVYLNEKFFILTGCKKQLQVFDKDMNLLTQKDLHDIVPEGFIGVYLYHYGKTLWIMGNDPNYGKDFSRIFVEIDPDTLKVLKTVRFPYPLAMDGDYSRIVKFKGQLYVLGMDYVIKPTGVQYGHEVIYKLAPLPKPIFISPYKVGGAHQAMPNRKPPQDEYFLTGEFIPINPDKKDFVLIGDSPFVMTASGKIKSLLPWPENKSYLYFTLSKRFFEVPEKIYDGTLFRFSTGIYCKRHIYIGTENYLLEFKNGRLIVRDKYKGNYYTPFFELINNSKN